jgi:hypothetical protein
LLAPLKPEIGRNIFITMVVAMARPLRPALDKQAAGAFRNPRSHWLLAPLRVFVVSVSAQPIRNAEVGMGALV